jgi:cytidylate kinase
MSVSKRINIAIDGPAGAGKSTVAKQVARQLGYVYVDTGAMYRAIAWKVLQEGVQGDEQQMIVVAEQTRITLQPGETVQKVFVDDVEVTELIRTPEISNFTSAVATIGEIRKLLVDMQQQMAEQKGIVMDGRDIGTHVLPNAELKLFLTASVEERAQRRYRELTAKNEQVSFEQIKADIAARDHMDETREVSPLVQATDALRIDSSDMTIEEVVQLMVRLAVEAGASVGAR